MDEEIQETIIETSTSTADVDTSTVTTEIVETNTERTPKRISIEV